MTPVLAGRAWEAAFLGVRTYHRLRPTSAKARRRWPMFRVEPGGVALTIDDGPDPRWTPALLDLLDAYAVPATFFLIGARVAQHPRLARRIAEAGHEIGNHSMHHPMPFAALRTGLLHDEVQGAQQQITDAVGQAPRLFRAPSGGWSPRVLDTVAQAGLTPVDWTVNSSDWKQPGVAHITRTLTRSRSGHVLLCHDGGGDRRQTVVALATVIPRLQRRGLRFVPVSPAPAPGHPSRAGRS